MYKLKERKPNQSPPKLEGVVIGLLSGLDSQQNPLVIFPGNLTDSPVVARVLSPCKFTDMGKEVALLFEEGDPTKPLIVGLIQNSTSNEPILTEPVLGADEEAHIELDGQRIELNARQSITLKCGRASITLTKAGKILIRGAYLSNRSSGVNRIKGGSVQIN